MYTEAEKFIEPYKAKISPELLAHPQFMRELNLALLNVKLGSGTDYANIKISENGESITISKAFTNDKVPTALRNNQEIFADTIELKRYENGVTFLETLQATGKFYDAKAYEPFLSQEERGKESYNGGNSVHASVSYYQSTIDQDGIYLATTTATDSFSLRDMQVNDEQSLKAELLSDNHKPTFAYKCPTMPPRIPNNMSASTFYRDYNNLGLVYSYSQTYTPQGTKNQKQEVYSLNTQYPELLRVHRIGEVENWKVISDVPSLNGMSISELDEKSVQTFRQSIENSETRKFDRKVYEALIRRTDEALSARTPEPTSVTR